MRRLNRDEYANTVRDLLRLDENVVRPLVEELPGDGKAEGFDRLGVALFFDQTQIERSLAVAKQIAERAIVTAPPKVNRRFSRFDDLRRRPPPAMVEVFPAFTHTIPRGAQDRIVRPDFIEYHPGLSHLSQGIRRLGRDRSFQHQPGRHSGRLLSVSHQGEGGQSRSDGEEQVSAAIRHGLADPDRERGGPRSIGNDRGDPVPPRSRQWRGERAAGLQSALEPHREGGHPRAELHEARFAVDGPAREDGTGGRQASSARRRWMR